MEMVSSRAFQGELTLNNNQIITNKDKKLYPIISSIGIILTLVGYQLSLLQDMSALGLLTISLLCSVIPNIILLSNQNTHTCSILLPFIDSCNHHSVNRNSELSLIPIDDCFYVKAIKNINPKEEVIYHILLLLLVFFI